MLAALALALLLQHQDSTGTGLSSPAAGDTAGYWQQRAHYRIDATLDETAQVLHATGTLTYVNASPDTLREMYVHQYLNAFRPGSRWSADDAREGRERFGALRDPAYGYERFTRQPEVDGTPVTVEYPGTPDSTVARFALPRPLAPGDSAIVRFAWDARPSTVARRQGRRGRHWDFAQWYPKVAVYDRGGWQANPLRPAGEFYGEFGSYDVSLTLAGDQVVAATGVPVRGDPGWERVRRWGTVNLMRDAYGDSAPAAIPASGSPARTVRWLARDVHHFAWSTSPEYRYEGGLYDGRIAIHVLYRGGDEAQWGSGQAVRRTETALRWLESVYGRYPYPQVTNLHRIDGGGTEFPMMVMNGSASQGLILHEAGHIYSFGILANNEWRSGWLDEGLTSYQTGWAQGTTPQERARGIVPIGGEPPGRGPARTGYAARALRPASSEGSELGQIRLDLVGRAEPIGRTAHEFGEFGIYNQMIYSRAELMYGQLRDAIGDSAFTRFLRTYYDRWQLRHVDERAMRRAAEDACGCALDWFFAQWVHRTGLTDYALEGSDVRRVGDRWVTRARVVRHGEYRHPMPVGARVGSEWIVARADPSRDEQWVEIQTMTEPDEIRLDPRRTVMDWDRRNDSDTRFRARGARHVIEWPFLDQSLRDRTLAAWLPLAWYTAPGGVTPALRLRSNYLGLVDRFEAGLGVAARSADSERGYAGERAIGARGRAGTLSRVQGWLSWENPRIGSRALIGSRIGAWALDGALKAELRRTWDRSPYLFARGPRRTLTAAVTGTLPFSPRWLDVTRWDTGARVADASIEYTDVAPGPWNRTLRLRAIGGGAFGDRADAFARAEGELRGQRRFGPGSRLLAGARLFAAAQTDRTPLQRSVGVVARDATDAFENHFLRGAGALLSNEDARYADLSGGGLRAYQPWLRTDRIAALNLETGVVAWRPQGGRRLPELHLLAFGDGAAVPDGEWLADAGVGVALRGALFDRDVRLRFDVPLWVDDPLAGVQGNTGQRTDRVRLRWTWSVRDLW